MRRLLLIAAVALFALFAPEGAARASLARPHTADRLLFCNSPESMRTSGAYADAHLTAGRTYRIFYHYRNATGEAAPFVIAFQGSAGKPFTLRMRKGIADPTNDPPHAGRQAMARFLKATTHSYTAARGYARFASRLPATTVASGVLTVRVDQDVRFRLYFRDNRRVVPQAKIIVVDAPHSEQAVALTAKADAYYARIGLPHAGAERLNGAYGMLYSFRITAPPGRRVRIAFSARGGKAGMVGTVNGHLHQSQIVNTSAWTVFVDSVVGPNGLVLTTLPFGGVFYPVELAFRLL